jgi:glucose-6-phosphate 1-epimerase
MVQSIEELQRFSRLAGVTIEWSRSNVANLHIQTEQSELRLSLFGAHVLSWAPAQHKNVTWISEGAVLDGIYPIRGGIPVCWPWFAGHPDHQDWPAHGFARTSIWTLEDIKHRDGQAVVRLSLPPHRNQSAYWPHQTRPVITFTIGAVLSMELSVTNSDPHPIKFSQALHTYFTVGDIDKVTIHGLENSPYIDKLTNVERSAKKPPIIINRETDRIYRQLAGPIFLQDKALERIITIEHEGARNAIVWNPWIEKSARLHDMGPPSAYRGMACIETGNAPPDALSLQPGETHLLKTTISVQDEIQTRKHLEAFPC